MNKCWALLVAGALTGCSGTGMNQGGAGPESPRVGRYQFIGKQVYLDGTIEYSCLDTATGSIGYASIPGDIKSAKVADFNCGN